MHQHQLLLTNLAKHKASISIEDNLQANEPPLKEARPSIGCACDPTQKISERTPVLRPVSWQRIAILYSLGLAALACAIVGSAMAWEAVTWDATEIAQLPPLMLQFCIGAAAAMASGLLAISCLVPAAVFHSEHKYRIRAPQARLIVRR